LLGNGQVVDLLRGHDDVVESSALRYEEEQAFIVIKFKPAECALEVISNTLALLLSDAAIYETGGFRCPCK
jgi:hypothetical protein